MTEEERRGDYISYELIVAIVTRVVFFGYNFPVGGTHIRTYAQNLRSYTI
jgi:hypothetical protein